MPLTDDFPRHVFIWIESLLLPFKHPSLRLSFSPGSLCVSRFSLDLKMLPKLQMSISEACCFHLFLPMTHMQQEILKGDALRNHRCHVLWPAQHRCPTHGCLHPYLEVRNLGCREVEWLTHFYRWDVTGPDAYPLPRGSTVHRPSQRNTVPTDDSWRPESLVVLNFPRFTQGLSSLQTIPGTPVCLPRTFFVWGPKNTPSFFKYKSGKAFS